MILPIGNLTFASAVVSCVANALSTSSIMVELVMETPPCVPCFAVVPAPVTQTIQRLRQCIATEEDRDAQRETETRRERQRRAERDRDAQRERGAVPVDWAGYWRIR